VLATILWDGEAGDRDWHNPLNWAGDVLPAEADEAVSNIETELVISQSVAVQSVSIERGSLQVTDATVIASEGRL